MKKCISVLLISAMILCMSITAFADGTYTLSESGKLTFTGNADMTSFDILDKNFSKNDTLSKSVVENLPRDNFLSDS